jgi:hypothetical protein
MAFELVDRLAILVAVRPLHGMGVADSRSLRSDTHVHLQHFLRRIIFVPFRRFLGDVRREFMQRLFMVLWVPISATLYCMRAGLTLWHGFMFLGLRFFFLFPLFA